MEVNLNTEVLIFDAGSLRPGDILLSTDPTSARSAVIRTATWSDYSHAAICVDPPYFVEAVWPSVMFVTCQRWGIRDRSLIRVLRLDPQGGGVLNAASISEAAAAAAQRFVGHEYWRSGAATARFSFLPVKQRSRFFCSHLVAVAYHEAGIMIAPGIAVDKVLPESLAQSTLVRNVTDEVLVPSHGLEDWLMLQFIDDHRITSPNDLEHETKRHIARKAKKIFAKRNVKINDGNAQLGPFDAVVATLLSVRDNQLARELDTQLFKLMKEEGLFGLFSREFRRYDIDLVRDKVVAEMLRSGSSSVDEIKDAHVVWSRILATRLAPVTRAQREVVNFEKLTSVDTATRGGEELSLLRALTEMHREVYDWAKQAADATQRLVGVLEKAMMDSMC